MLLIVFKFYPAVKEMSHKSIHFLEIFGTSRDPPHLNPRAIQKFLPGWLEFVWIFRLRRGAVERARQSITGQVTIPIFAARAAAGRPRIELQVRPANVLPEADPAVRFV